jgi:predicted permease
VRQLLVASQVALALVMLAGAGLLGRSLRRLTTIDLGLRADHLSIIDLSVPVSKLKSEEEFFGVLDAIAPPLAAVRGVTSLTPIIMPPLMGPNFWTGVWQADWQSPEQAHANAMIPFEGGGPDYFRTFGIPILRGRGFLDSDRKGAPKVVVVSEAVAHRYWPDQDAIGKRIRQAGDTEPWRTVVGVAGESRFRALREPTPMIYMPWRQSYWQGMIAVRTTVDITTLLPTIRRTISEAEPGVMVWTARPMDEYLGVQLAQPRLSALLLSAFGLVALVLAAVGLYGVMASAVRQQTREIGVRMALGATSARVRREVLGTALGITAIGAAAGVFVALVSSKLLTALLYEVSPTDPVVLVGACAVLVGVAAIAAYVPARYASRVDPARVLQAE